MSNPSKGPGNGNPPHPPFGQDPEKTQAAAERGGFVRQKMAQFRRENPDAPLSTSEQERQIRAALRDAVPEVLDAMIEVAKDKDHKDFGATSRAIVDQAIGRAKQGVELTGKDGGPVTIQTEADIERRIAAELDRASARSRAAGSHSSDSADA